MYVYKFILVGLTLILLQIHCAYKYKFLAGWLAGWLAGAIFSPLFTRVQLILGSCWLVVAREKERERWKKKKKNFVDAVESLNVPKASCTVERGGKEND